MRRVLGLFGFALALPWVACEDHTVSLSQDQKTGLSSAGGTSGGTSSGGTTSGGTSSTSFGDATTSDMGSGGSFNAGNTNFGVPSSNGATGSFPFGAGGSNGPTGGNHTVNAGGSGPVGSLTTGGNEGGQGPECEDQECSICASARSYCNVPTPDCTEDEGWFRKCNRCDPQCPGDSTCFQDFKCRPACLGEGTCPLENPHCDPTFGACVQCYLDEHCAQFGRVCFAGECVECVSQSDCDGPGNDYCIAGECVECVSSDDCGGRTCDPFNRCLECDNDGECDDDEKPLCYLGACTECFGEIGCNEDEYCSNFTCSPR